MSQSIFDLCDRFEYQRTGARWADVQENLQRFRDLRKRHANIQLQCCSTINIFNVRYIDQLANWISVQGFDFVYWNIMHDAPYFSVATLPDRAKQAIADHLNTALIPFKYKKDFAGIVDFMMRGQSTDGAETLHQIQKLDQRRDQNLKIVAPELAELLNYVKT